MDLNMPELNGLDTTKTLRKLAFDKVINLNNTKIILYSCLSNTDDSHKFLKEFDDVADKPINLDNLKLILIKYRII